MGTSISISTIYSKLLLSVSGPNSASNGRLRQNYMWAITDMVCSKLYID